MERPARGIAVDAAHSVKNGMTEYQAVDLDTGELLFSRQLGNQTVNIGEFLGVVEAVKYIIENGFEPRVIYTDSMTAVAWYNSRATASAKHSNELLKAELFLKAMDAELQSIEVVHWDNRLWGETPADFGRK